MSHPAPSVCRPGLRIVVMLSALLPWLIANVAVAQSTAATGTVTGRILNEATGQYLRSAIVTVVGTNISTLAESGGAYTLTRDSIRSKWRSRWPRDKPPRGTSPCAPPSIPPW
jgi:hypothetical protein